MHDLLPDDQKADTSIVAISPDSVDTIVQVVAKVEAQTKKPFAITLLSDSDHEVIDQYGLLNETAAKRNRFLPHPTTYLIDPEGVVRWKFTEKDYKIRPTNQAILEALKAMRQRSR